MKKSIHQFLLIFIFGTLLFTNHLQATTIESFNISKLSIPSEEIKSYEIIDKSDGILIVKVETKDGKSIFNVIAAIATAFLPEIVEGICTRTVGDPDACKVAYEVTSALVSLRGTRIYKGISKGLNYVANRGYYNSSAVVETKSYYFASKVKDAFSVYKDYGCVDWKTVQHDEGNNSYTSSNNSSIEIYNSSGDNVEYRLSADGIHYDAPVYIQDEYYASYKVHNMSYLYIYIYGNTFKLKRGQDYEIYYDWDNEYFRLRLQ